MSRLVLLLTSPRVAAGLLSRDAWVTLGAAALVLARDGDDPTSVAVAQSGVPVAYVGALDPVSLARLLLERLGGLPGDLVWIGSDDGDDGLTDALATEVSRRSDPPDVEILVGSYDVQGSRLLDVVAVMDRLRSPGGCPWDAQQTHRSLAPYLLEEAYEAIEAIEAVGDLPGAEAVDAGDGPDGLERPDAPGGFGTEHLVEELGDVLLQVVFHARVGQEDARAPFDIDDVAAGIVAKLVRRHPHVFAGGSATTPAEVEAGWEQIKAVEKPGRSRVGDGIPALLPALARADKVLSRLERSGRSGTAEELVGEPFEEVGADQVRAIGVRLLGLVAEARAAGVDAEAELRAVLRGLESLPSRP